MLPSITMKSTLTFQQIRLINLILAGMVTKTRILESTSFLQHGTTTVFEHSLSVTYYSLKIASFFGWKINEESLVRGALLHDYFLYDWHDKKTRLPLHGFTHPAAALENAKKVCEINSIEEDIIKHHMFPLTLVPPKTKEGILVSIADKICSLFETFKMNEWFGGIWKRKNWSVK